MMQQDAKISNKSTRNISSCEITYIKKLHIYDALLPTSGQIRILDRRIQCHSEVSRLCKTSSREYMLQQREVSEVMATQ